jgi:hypothetical protein
MGLTLLGPAALFSDFHESQKTGYTMGNVPAQNFLREMPLAAIPFLDIDKDDTVKRYVVDGGRLQMTTNIQYGNTVVTKAFLIACLATFGLTQIRKNSNIGRFIAHRNPSGEPITMDLPEPFSGFFVNRTTGQNIFSRYPPGDNGTGKAIRYWVERAKMHIHIHFYDARHTFTCQPLNNGANPKTVSDVALQPGKI